MREAAKRSLEQVKQWANRANARGSAAGRSSRAASLAPLGLGKVTLSLPPAMFRLHLCSERAEKSITEQSALKPELPLSGVILPQVLWQGLSVGSTGVNV